MTAKDHHPHSPAPRDSKTALLQAAQAAIEERRAKPGRAAGPREGRSGLLRSLLAALCVSGTTLVVLQPVWLAGPSLPNDSPAVKVATARLVLLRETSHVQGFLLREGHLPGTLAEAGIPDPAIAYRPTGESSFELSLRVGDSLVMLRSTDSLRLLAINALRILQSRSGS